MLLSQRTLPSTPQPAKRVSHKGSRGRWLRQTNARHAQDASATHLKSQAHFRHFGALDTRARPSCGSMPLPTRPGCMKLRLTQLYSRERKSNATRASLRAQLGSDAQKLPRVHRRSAPTCSHIFARAPRFSRSQIQAHRKSQAVFGCLGPFRHPKRQTLASPDRQCSIELCMWVNKGLFFCLQGARPRGCEACTKGGEALGNWEALSHPIHIHLCQSHQAARSVPRVMSLYDNLLPPPARSGLSRLPEGVRGHLPDFTLAAAPADALRQWARALFFIELGRAWTHVYVCTGVLTALFVSG